MFENREVEERVLLVAVRTPDGVDTEESLAELSELVRTAGAAVTGSVIQNLPRPNAATYVGSGKVEEIRDLLWETEATGIVCDDELKPAQMKNLTDLLDTKVMDRTLLILDIFAGRAATSEGKLQVELAQLRYNLTRLAGFGHSMSRLGGGIGTRGPGEKKLETDRRVVRDRIAQLEGELEEVVRHRDVTRARRRNSHTRVAAIVGYTNAGKSTLLNALTNAGVLEEDRLFATLDPTTRILTLPDEQQVLLTDTVGFIRKLPHHLVNAFRSTLEEARYADLILHVVDASNPGWPGQIDVVYQTLRDFGVTEQKVFTLFNKCDKLTGDEVLTDPRADRTLRISAKTGEGLDAFLEILSRMLREDKVLFAHTFPYDQAGEIQKIRKYGELLTEEYRDDGIFVEAYVPENLF